MYLLENISSLIIVHYSEEELVWKCRGVTPWVCQDLVLLVCLPIRWKINKNHELIVTKILRMWLKRLLNTCFIRDVHTYSVLSNTIDVAEFIKIQHNSSSWSANSTQEKKKMTKEGNWQPSHLTLLVCRKTLEADSIISLHLPCFKH